MKQARLAIGLWLAFIVICLVLVSRAQKSTLKEAQLAVREREQFLEESETRLFEKVQTQQEKETELEQREEDLRTRSKEFRDKLALIDPQAAAALKDETATKKIDEFNE